MKELEYPFDAEYILQKKKKIKRELLTSTDNFIKKKIAILGGSTTNDIKLVLELFLLNYGIQAEFYESEYNQYYEEAVFENEELQLFKPDIIYIHTTNRNISSYPQIADSKETIDQLLENEMARFRTMWESIEERYHCPIIQNNFEMPFYRLLGNKDASDIHGKVNFLTRLNMLFYEYAQQHEDFYICDINYISADYGLSEWSDPFYYHMYKYALNVAAIPYLAFNVANIIKSIFGKNKKGLVLDLDNTLWGGVIGDDGVENIMLGPETSEGQIYSEFQRYIKEIRQLGIVLNIASKNDYETAIKGLQHPDSELKHEDFIVIKANWNPKNQNFVDIATQLNVLPDSLVFVDDNPAERHIVKEQIPGVSAPEIREVQKYIQIIDHSGFFETTTLSEEDIQRNEMYEKNARRQEQQGKFSDYKEYLLSLKMVGIIKPFESIYMARIAQLTNKSNQFNLTTKRYTQDEIETLAADKHYITLYGKLIDSFGDNGVVSVIIGYKIEKVCHIDLWLMSCRVLKRDMECAMMDKLVQICKEQGIEEIRGYYYPTKKNHMVERFYEMQGFEKIKEDEQGNTEWKLINLEKYKNKNSVIKMEE